MNKCLRGRKWFLLKSRAVGQALDLSFDLRVCQSRSLMSWSIWRKRRLIGSRRLSLEKPRPTPHCPWNCLPKSHPGCRQILPPLSRDRRNSCSCRELQGPFCFLKALNENLDHLIHRCCYPLTPPGVNAQLLLAPGGVISLLHLLTPALHPNPSRSSCL